MIKPISQGVVGIALIGISALIALILVFSGGDLQKKDPQTRSSLVEVITMQRGDEKVFVEAFGTVQAKRELMVRPEVSGKVIEQSPHLVIGGKLKEGEMLVKIDPRNYLATIEQEEAAVEKAEFEIKLEEGRQVVAEKEWEILEPSIKDTEIGEELALRKPHLKEKLAALESAKSKLEKAQYDLERATIKAPFDAVVLKESVEMGQLINSSTDIATLVATDAFRVQVSIPFDQLEWISIPGANATVYQEFRGERTLQWTGKVTRLLSNIDPKTRLARVIVTIPDPLEPPNPLLIGTYVRVTMEGHTLENVFSVPRIAVRDGNTVWIKDKEGKLEIREITIVQRRKNTVLVKEGLSPGDEIIVSPLPLAIPGMQLKTK